MPPTSEGPDPNQSRVAVVGLGQIGLPLALLIAQDRHVTGVDVDQERLARIRSGELPVTEPEVQELFEARSERLDLQSSVPDEHHDTYVIVTPTPLNPNTLVADLEYVRAATASVGSALSPGDLVVLESTVPPGTSTAVVLPTLEAEGIDRGEFHYAHCPERALPGNTVREMVENHRVLGVTNESAAAAATDLYGFVSGEIHLTTPTTAEFVKLIENTYRDINIAAANEFAILAERAGIDGREAIELANEHPRVDILSPGPGVGGHCIPVDPLFLTQAHPDARMITVAREVNNAMAGHVLSLVRQLVGGRTQKITMLGVAYKGGVADTRETPATRFHQLAKNEGYEIAAYDPHVESYQHELVPFPEAIAGSNCLVILTDHPEFDDLSPQRIGEAMERRMVVDSRGILDREAWLRAGFTVRTLGDGRGIPSPDAERDTQAATPTGSMSQ